MRKFILFSILVILAVFGWAVYQSSKVDIKVNEQMGVIKPNRPAPSFSMPDINTGEVVSLDSLRGRIIVLNFWASWCKPCQEEVQELNRFYDEVKDSVYVLGINVWDTRSKALQFMKEHSIRFPVLHSKNSPITVDYGINGVPETIVIDSSGVIRMHFKGPITYDILKKALEEIRSG